VTYQDTTEALSDLTVKDAAKQLPIIIRATNGKTDPKTKSKAARINLSTIVEPDSLNGFFLKYAEVCKLGMSGLKKRDRSKGKKKLKAKKKKVGAAGATEEIKKE
jgi:signal recognition particle subunit SRP14